MCAPRLEDAPQTNLVALDLEVGQNCAWASTVSALIITGNSLSISEFQVQIILHLCKRIL